MKKPTLDRCNRLIEDGFSLMPVKADKVPLMKWDGLQENPLNKDNFEEHYNRAEGIGIITGYDYLEVIV